LRKADSHRYTPPDHATPTMQAVGEFNAVRDAYRAVACISNLVASVRAAHNDDELRANAGDLRALAGDLVIRRRPHEPGPNSTYVALRSRRDGLRVDARSLSRLERADKSPRASPC
jgi:hypothetical protein